MNKKPVSRLGRGLSSLMSIPSLDDAETEALAGGGPVRPLRNLDGPEILQIPTDQIVPNPNQPRRRFDDASLAQLAASLKSAGLVQPIVVRTIGSGYELIAGERRLRAAKLAGLPELPAIVRSATAAEQAELALVENVQREDLNSIDRAAAYRNLLQQLGLTQQGLADRLGEDRSSIANHLRLLDLAQPAQELIRDGKLSLGHAKLLAGVPDLLVQERLATEVVAQQLTVRGLETLIAQHLSTAPRATQASTSADVQPHLADLEKRITQQLGLRVQVKRAGKGKGRLILHYGSLDQFDQLLQRLAVELEPS